MDAATKEFLASFSEVILTAAESERKDMKLTQFDGFAPPPPSVSVGQDWAAYIASRQQEKPMVSVLLSDALLSFGVRTIAPHTGRRPFPLRDKLFLCIEKVHRQATYDAMYEWIDYFHTKGYITHKPEPHTISNYMNDPQLTQILEDFITYTSTALATLEHEFAVDATGVGGYGKRWVSVRLKKGEHKEYRKLHTLVGARHGIITAAKATVGTRGDSPQFILLLDKMKRYFKIIEVTGDGAYTSRANAQAIEDIGAVPYLKIVSKIKSARNFGYPAWGRMIRKSRQNPTLYKAHYAKRSNVESVYGSFKKAITARIDSKNPIAQENEALCIAVVHNLRTLVRAMFMLGINPLRLKR